MENLLIKQLSVTKNSLLDGLNGCVPVVLLKGIQTSQSENNHKLNCDHKGQFNDENDNLTLNVKHKNNTKESTFEYNNVLEIISKINWHQSTQKKKIKDSFPDLTQFIKQRVKEYFGTDESLDAIKGLGNNSNASLSEKYDFEQDLPLSKNSKHQPKVKKELKRVSKANLKSDYDLLFGIDSISNETIKRNNNRIVDMQKMAKKMIENCNVESPTIDLRINTFTFRAVRG